MSRFADLDELLDAHRGEPQPETAPPGAPFRDFDDEDWQAFAGCETRNPQIADPREDVTLLVDGSTVSALSGAFHAGAESLVFARTFKAGPVVAAALARSLAHALERTDNVNRELVAFLGEPVGEL